MKKLRSCSRNDKKGQNGTRKGKEGVNKVSFSF